MSAYEQQLIAKYHQADLLSEAREARLARIAKDAQPQAQRVVMASLTGPLQSILTSARAWVGAHSAGRTAAAKPSIGQRPMARGMHPR